MTKRINAKYKITRALGVNLWGRNKCPLTKRDSAPGQHGANKKKKVSEYGRQLIAKQKLKKYYGYITEKQFRNLYLEAVRRIGDKSENMVKLLEKRLDTVVYRMKFAPTVFAARQFVVHKHILVNGKSVNIPSYMLKEGDVISVRSDMRENVIILGAIDSNERDIPVYITMTDKYEGTFTRDPSIIEVPYPVKMEPNLVVEFYSR